MTPTEPTKARDQELAMEWALARAVDAKRRANGLLDNALTIADNRHIDGFLAGRASMREEMNARIEEAVRKERERCADIMNFVSCGTPKSVFLKLFNKQETP